MDTISLIGFTLIFTLIILLVVVWGFECEDDSSYLDFQVYGFGLAWSKTRFSNDLAAFYTTIRLGRLFLVTPAWCPFGLKLDDIRW